MDIILKDKKGVTLLTSKKHCKEDINVKVETEEITITPSTELQIQEGLFSKVTVLEAPKGNDIRIEGSTLIINESNTEGGTLIL